MKKNWLSIKKLNLKYIEEKLIINKENKEIKFEIYRRKLMLLINKEINFEIYWRKVDDQ